MFICRLHTLSSVCTITVRRGACLLTATKEYLCTTLLGNESDRPDWSGFVSTITEWLFFTQSTFAPRIFLSFNHFHLKRFLCCYDTNMTITECLLHLRTES